MIITKRFAAASLTLAMAVAMGACSKEPAATTTTDGVVPTDVPTDLPTDDLPPAGGTFTIAYQGALTGDNAALGQNMLYGVELAVQEYNDSADAEYVLEVLELDTQGDPAQAPALAQQAAGDASVLAVVGPGFSGETAAAGPIYEEAGLPFVTPSATNPNLSTEGWTNFFRTVATDASQAPVAAKFIAETLGNTKVAIVDDASEYGKGLADGVDAALVAAGVEVVMHEGIEAGGTDFSTVVGQIVQSGAESVFYGGYYSDAGNLRKQLAEQGGEAIVFVSGDGTYDPGFITNAGDAAEGSHVTFPGADPGAQGAAFIDGIAAICSCEGPGAYTVESYQNTLLVIEALKAAGPDRVAIRQFLDDFNGEIFGKTITFADNGDIAAQSFFVFTVEGGVWVQKEAISA